MTQHGWRMIGFAFASMIYWTTALSFWLLLVLSYGDCGTMPGYGRGLNNCQNQKVLIVWGALGAIILVYVVGLLIRRKIQVQRRNGY
jgi:hypothetical protein